MLFTLMRINYGTGLLAFFKSSAFGMKLSAMINFILMAIDIDRDKLGLIIAGSIIVVSLICVVIYIVRYKKKHRLWRKPDRPHKKKHH